MNDRTERLQRDLSGQREPDEQKAQRETAMVPDDVDVPGVRVVVQGSPWAGSAVQVEKNSEDYEASSRPGESDRAVMPEDVLICVCPTLNQCPTEGCTDDGIA